MQHSFLFPILSTTLTLSLIIIFVQPIHSLNYVRSAYEIKDIYSKNGLCFSNEAATWSATTLRASKVYTTCSDYGLLGGYGVLGSPYTAYNSLYSKTYTALPSHNMIFYTMTVYAIDSWTYGSSVSDNDHYSIAFDSATVTGSRFSYYTFFEGLCGSSSSYDLRNIRMFGRKNHLSSTLTLSIIDLLSKDSQTASVGVRDINLLFVTATGVSEYMCQLAPMSPDNACLCPEGQYKSGSSCVSCHPNCASCFGAAANQCYQCNVGNSLINNACTTCADNCATCHGTSDTECDACVTGYSLFNNTSCVYPCTSPLVASVGGLSGCTNMCSSPCLASEFVYWDNYCSSTCNRPFRRDSVNKYVKGCSFPCTGSDYLYWNGACASSCPSPLTGTLYKGKNVCTYTCSVGQYLYWDKSCGDTCPLPLVLQVSQDRLLCTYPCMTGQFLYWNGSCLADCQLPLTSRVNNSQNFCDYGCQPNEFLFWDGSCSTICDFSLTASIEGTFKPRQYCRFLGSITDSLYWNSSYIATCSFPLIQTTYKNRFLCTYSCTNMDYLYWNGSCLSTCDYPLSTRIESGLNYCDFSCPSGEFLMWDRSCSLTCPSPLNQRIEGSSMIRKFCTSPCPSTKYVYWDDSCAGTCDAPLTHTTFNGQNICNYPCTNTEDILYYNGSCLSDCPSPYGITKILDRAICTFPCPQPLFFYWDGTCISSCNAPLISTNGGFHDSWCKGPCASPLLHYNVETKMCNETCQKGFSGIKDLYLQCVSHPIIIPEKEDGLVEAMLAASDHKGQPSFITLTLLTQYIGYVDFPLPSRLERLAQTRQRNIWSWRLGFTIPSALEKFFVKRSIPDIFSKHKLHSSFIVNFWNEILLLVSFVVIGCTFKCFEKAGQRFSWPNLHKVAEKMRIICLWNLPIMLLAISIDDIIIYSYLDFSTFSTTDAPVSGSVSIGISLVTIFGVIAMIGSGIHIIKRSNIACQSNKKDLTDDHIKTIYKKWEAQQVLYIGYQQDTYSKQLFFIIYTLRVALIAIATISLLSIPIILTVLQLFIAVVVLGFILFKQPIGNRTNHIQLILVETGAFFVSICSLALSILCTNETAAITHKNIILGDLIIIGNIYINGVFIVFLIIKVIQEFKAIRAYQKTQSEEDYSQWLHLLIPLLQQGAFGFEEFLPDSLSNRLQLSIMTESSNQILQLTKDKLNLPYLSRSKISQIFPETSSFADGLSPNRESSDFSLARDRLYAPIRMNTTSPMSDKNSEILEFSSMSPATDKLQTLSRIDQTSSGLRSNSGSPGLLNLGQARNKLYSPIQLNKEPNSSRDINSSDPSHLKNQKELENKSEQSTLELNSKQIIAQCEAITVHPPNNRPPR